MKHVLSLSLLAAVAAPAAAQNTLIFSGRFPFVSLDAANERVGGSISQLEEFDFSFCTPGAGAFARSLMPATGHQAYLGDGDGDGNYTKFLGLKTYFQQLQIGGLFVKAADQAFVTADRVYFTVRDNVPQDIEVFTNGGTTVEVLEPGDFVRFTANGSAEFFITADQFDIAAGPPTATGSSVKGAGALCQDAAGNLYYSPPQGGHWVNGNQGGPYFANDGSIVMIPAAAITYDAAGNVAAVVANSAILLFEEVNGGISPAPLSVRGMVANSGAMDRTGGPVGVYAKTCGLDLDPNGGTTTGTYPDANGAFPTVPNFVFCSDPGGYAGTIFSTAGSGSVATINGVLCGSTTLGVPADGSWLGVQLDIGNFQPTLMGLTVVDQINYEPLILDMPNFGGLENNAITATWDIDVHGAPGLLTFVIAQLGPGAAGSFPTSIPSALVPVLFTADSHWQIFVAAPPSTLGFLVTDNNGYGTLSMPNPHTGAFTGTVLMLQAAGLAGADVQASNPVLMQLK